MVLQKGPIPCEADREAVIGGPAPKRSARQSVQKNETNPHQQVAGSPAYAGITRYASVRRCSSQQTVVARCGREMSFSRNTEWSFGRLRFQEYRDGEWGREAVVRRIRVRCGTGLAGYTIGPEHCQIRPEHYQIGPRRCQIRPQQYQIGPEHCQIGSEHYQIGVRD